jgi:glucose/arabinose dehydrogenase
MAVKKFIAIVVILFFLAGLAWAGIFLWKNFRGAVPSIINPPQNISELLPPARQPVPPSENSTGMPLGIPDGFSISIFAKNLSGARVMLFDSLGNMWVSRTGQGAVTLLEIKDGNIINQSDIFQNLNNPHGLALDPEDPFNLFIAEENKISRVRIYSEGNLQKISDLPEGSGHFTRTLGFGPDPSNSSGQASRLYVSIGSSCNVCAEKDSRRAKIFSLNKDGSDFREFAAGLRNTVFFTWDKSGKMWGADMGRDYSGDNLPPDEINIIEGDPSTELGVKNYGWPYCYGKNIHDDNFDSRKVVSCSDKISSHIDIPAHSAPLGLAFQNNSSWPEEYQNNLFVSYHGSWNRTTPTGYKVVRFQPDESGNYQGAEDFISGWLESRGVLGRPVDIKIGPDGEMYISDDRAGVIYKVEYLK